MILLPTDEAAAFDALAIAEVKVTRGLPKAALEYDRLRFALAATLGDIASVVIDSTEYATLRLQNQIVFDLVELASTNRVSAKAVYDANAARYAAKRRLQAVYFKSPLLEVKTCDLVHGT